MASPPTGRTSRISTSRFGVLGIIDAKKNGSSGQPQAGVDIFGRDPRTEGWVGIQCKRKGQWPPKTLTTQQIKDETRRAAKFKPPLSQFIVATTAQRDVECQEFVRRLGYWRRKGRNFSVDLYAPEDILDLLQDGPQLKLREKAFWVRRAQILQLLNRLTTAHLVVEMIQKAGARTFKPSKASAGVW